MYEKKCGNPGHEPKEPQLGATIHSKFSKNQRVDPPKTRGLYIYIYKYSRVLLDPQTTRFEIP